jgi:hypothetical protein
VIAVGDNHRRTDSSVPAGQKNRRQPPFLANPLEVVCHMRVVLFQKRQPAGAQDVLGFARDSVCPAKPRDQGGTNALFERERKVVFRIQIIFDGRPRIPDIVLLRHFQLT